MAKKFKVLVSNIVHVPVKATIKEAGKEKAISAVLVCDRLTAEELKDELKDGERQTHDVLRKVCTGWEHQNVVHDEETDKPAEFCAEALNAFLSVPGVASVAFHSYLAEVGAKAKN